MMGKSIKLKNTNSPLATSSPYLFSKSVECEVKKKIPARKLGKSRVQGDFFSRLASTRPQFLRGYFFDLLHARRTAKINRDCSSPKFSCVIVIHFS